MLLEDRDGNISILPEDYLERYAALDEDGMTIEEAIREHEQLGYRFVGPEALLPADYLEELRIREETIERLHSEVISRLDRLDAESIKPLEGRIVATLDRSQQNPRSDPDRPGPPISHRSDEIGVPPDSIRELMTSRGVLPDKQWFTTEEAAKVLDKSTWQIRNKWCKLGRIHCEKVGEHYRISLDGLLGALNHGCFPPHPIGTYAVE
jgi:hypothetical protein